MKYSFQALMCILFVQFSFGQTVNIPDANFKAELLISSADYPNLIARDLNGDYIAIDANQDGEIQNSEAENVSYLYIVDANVMSLQGIEAFSNLEYLTCSNNQITSLDISQLSNLQELQCNDNNLTEIDLSANLSLEDLQLENNQLTTIDVSNLYNLEFASFNYNQLTTLFLKTGSEPNVVFVQNPVEYVCCEDSRVAHYEQYLENFVGCTDCVVNSYCSFTPGGEFYTITGETRLDLDTNGCNDTDALYPNLKISIDNGENQDAIAAGNDGDYYLSLQQGQYTLTPQLENLTYFTVIPSEIIVEIPEGGTAISQNFCVSPDGVKNDVEIAIVPLEEARPGFETDYKIVYKNKGNTVVSGTIELLYSNDYMELLSATPSAATETQGTLLWDYIDLMPFETREIDFTMELNTPVNPEFPLNGGDMLNYDATINLTGVDEIPEDNSLTFSQEVVNSFDPNDITCLEGDQLLIEKVGEFVHYVIRFENTGTASAVNVVVKDVIDLSKYNVNTLVPMSASHPFETRIKNTNEVEFIFEDIQLPFDDANNDGYVMFKIRTLENLMIGEVFSTSAEIYFDFNAPILTNTASTEIIETLSLSNLLNSTIEVFPNPANSQLNISGQTAINNLKILDMNGRLLYDFPNSGLDKSLTIDVSRLTAGVYFLKVDSKLQQEVVKFVKK